MNFRGEKGQITIFLTIILLAVIFFTGVLVDVARLKAAETQVKRAVELASMSVLADYDSKLKEDYGIFSLGSNDERQLEKKLNEYLEKNLMISNEDYGVFEGTQHINIYNYRVESISITPIYNLSENEVVRDQILKYMKFRAPVEIIKGVWEKLSAVKSASKMSEAYKKRIEIDKLLGRIDKEQQKLKKCISGYGSNNEDGNGKEDMPYINMFNLNGSRDKLVSNYADLALTYKSLLDSICELDEKIRKAQDDAENDEEKIAKEETAVEETVADNGIEWLEKEREELQKNSLDILENMNSTWKELVEKETRLFISPNVEAEKCINEIVEIGRVAKVEITKLEEYLKAEEDDDDVLFCDFKKTCEEDIEKLKSLTLQGESAELLRESVLKNINVINGAIEGAGYIRNVISKQEISMLTREKTIETLNAGVIDYNNMLQYGYLKPEKGEKKNDPRDGLSKLIKENLDQKSDNDKDMKQEGINIEDLPSKKTVRSKDFDAEDKEFLEEENKHIIDKEVKYKGDLHKIDEEIDLKNEKGTFAENAFGFISSMGNILSKGLVSIRDEIYINEYIMETFKSSCKVSETTTNEKKRDTFFDSEVEYILHGNSSEKINKVMTEAEILLMRFGLNTLHVYSDANKKSLSNIIASAVAGWWTGGAGIPIISNLIMCGWGMGEAILDLNELKDGKAVPFYKSKGDWRLDIGIAISDDDEKSEPMYSFTYHDYLRLFLILINSETKLDRLEDLIELNISNTRDGFKMWGANTYMRVEAEVSVNYLFVTQPFIPVKMKTEDRRHLIKVVLYEGY